MWLGAIGVQEIAPISSTRPSAGQPVERHDCDFRYLLDGMLLATNLFFLFSLHADGNRQFLYPYFSVWRTREWRVLMAPGGCSDFSGEAKQTSGTHRPLGFYRVTEIQ